MSEVRSVLSAQAMLGEGPVWVAREQALWFVDIKSHKVHRFDPATGDHRAYDAPCQVGWVLPAQDGKFLAGLQQGIARFDPATGAFDVIHAPEAAMPGNRLNDATVDPAGRVVVGLHGERLRVAVPPRDRVRRVGLVPGRHVDVGGAPGPPLRYL